MKVLVTGGTSLIGRHTVDALVRGGHDVTTFQRGEHSGGASIRGSITDHAGVVRACTGRDAVIHLAARSASPASGRSTSTRTSDGTELLVDVARRTGVRRFVHVSSPSVAHAGEPLVGAGAAPADPTRTRGHYATSKAMAEIVGARLHRRPGCPSSRSGRTSCGGRATRS